MICWILQTVCKHFANSMSKTIAIRVSDDIYSALEAQCLATGKTMTQLVTPIILGMIELPAAPLSPIEQRLAVIEDRVLAITELETQMLGVVDRLDVLEAADKPTIAHFDPKLAETSEGKSKAESSRDLDKGGTITSEKLVTTNPDICEAIIAALKHDPESGYYFRSEYLGQKRISHSYRKQAIKMGFSYEHINLDGKATRVWLNRDYCLQSM